MGSIANWLGSGVTGITGSSYGVGMPGLNGIVPGPTSGPTGVGGWVSTLLGTGIDVYKTKTAADIASKQISAGQYPTVVGQNGNLSGTANISGAQVIGSGLTSGLSSTVLTVGGILLVLLLIFAMIGKR